MECKYLHRRTLCTLFHRTMEQNVLLQQYEQYMNKVGVYALRRIAENGAGFC